MIPVCICTPYHLSSVYRNSTSNGGRKLCVVCSKSKSSTYYKKLWGKKVAYQRCQFLYVGGMYFRKNTGNILEKYR